jgi:hypothetical protein
MCSSTATDLPAAALRPRDATMEAARPNRAVFYALCANAVLLFAILLTLLARNGSSPFPESIAFAAAPAPAPQPIAGGPGGIYLMPGQLQKERWGCWVLDVNRETLVAYEYFPGTSQLKLAAARTIRFDRALEHYNTAPPPEEIEQLLNAGRRQRPGGAAPRAND